MPLWGASLAGVLAALSYELVEHGSEARAYAPVALLVVVFAMALERAAAEPTGRWLVTLAAVTAMGAYTHYFFLLSAAAGVVWVWTSTPREARGRVSAAIAGGVLTLLPWLPSMAHQRQTQRHSYINSFSVNGLLNLYPNTFAQAGTWEYTGTAGRIALVAVVLAGAACLWRRRDGRLCALLALLPVVLSSAMWAGGARIVDTRNLIVVAPFAAIALAAAVAAIPSRPVAYAAGVCVVVAMAAAFWLQTSEGRTPSDKLAAELVRLGWTSPDAVRVFAPYPDELALSWALPAHPPPVRVAPVPGACASLFAVVESRRGHRWLREHRDAVLDHVAVPFFGFGPEGKRHAVDAQVVRLRWSSPLAETVPLSGASLVHMGQGAPRCATPVYRSRRTGALGSQSVPSELSRWLTRDPDAGGSV